MRRPALLLPRFSAALALGLLVGACSHLPPSGGGAKPVNPPAVAQQAPVPPAVESQQLPPAPPQSASAEPVPVPVPPPEPMPNTAPHPVTAAILVPLSGPSAQIGAALFNAAQLALFEVGDDTFTLLPLDTKGTPEGAQLAAQQAIGQHADIILGPLFSAEAKAIAPLARQAGINVLSFTSDRQAVGDGIYSLGFLPGPQAAQVAQYARGQGRPRLAILAPSSDYGRRMVEWLNNDPATAPAVVSVQYYDPTAIDLSGPIRRLVKSAPQHPEDPGFDSLLLPDEGARLKNLAAMLSMQGVDPAKIKLLGTMLWADSKPETEPALAGSWFAAPPDAGHGDFDTRYLHNFGTKPPRIASLGYDATALAAVMARQGSHDFSGIRLTAATGFAGIDGIFRLLPDGTSERGYAIYEVVPSAPAKQIAPAPAAFQAAY